MKCRCRGNIRIRRQRDGWCAGTWKLYGRSIAVSVRVHTGDCPLADEVLNAWAVKD